MDEQHNAAYPEPGSGPYATPYPSVSHQQDGYSYGYTAPEDDYYPPMPQPLMHEGYIPRDDADTDVDEDPSDGYGALKAQFGLNFVLNPHSTHPHFLTDPRLAGGDVSEIMRDSEFEDEPIIHRSRLNSIDRELLDVNNNPEVDPDFAMSDQEGQTSDSMSINSDLLDDILQEEDDSSKRGRGRGRGRGSGRGRRGWKWALAGTEHDPKLQRGGTRGRPRGRGRGNNVPRGEGRRKNAPKNVAAEPDPEFKRLQALATQNFLSSNWQAAADYARDAVKVNPEIFAAHSLLSEILLAQGKEQDSLTVLLHGAHTKRDPALWWHVAERSLELAGEDRTLDVLEQAIYCFAWAIKLDPDDYDARREKLNLLLESEQPARARAECKMMVRQRPHDLNIVKQYADLCAYSGNLAEIQRAKDAYDVAINFYFKGKSLGLPDTQWSHLNIYLDLVEKSETAAKAAFHLRKLSRWLLGRKEDTFWDNIEGDDREFDMDDVPRRIQIQEFKYSRFSRQRHLYGEGLPLELRVKLGTFRVKMGRVHLPEAMQHFQHLYDLRDDISEYYDLFKDVAESLKDQTYYHEAITFFEPVRSVPEACDHAYFMNLADCYTILERNAEAEECWKFIIDNDPNDIKSRIALAKLYEAEQRMAEAVPLVHEVIRLGRSDAVKKANISVTKPPPRQMAHLRPKHLNRVEGSNHSGPMSRTYTLPPAMDEEDMPDEDDQEYEEEEEEDDEPIPTLRPKKSGRPRKQPKEKQPAKVSRTFENIQMQSQRIKANHLLLNSAKDTMNEDEDALETWMIAAHSMLDDFRNTRVFYPGRDKHLKFTGYGKSAAKSSLMAEMEAMKKRITNAEDMEDDEDEVNDKSIPDNFHDIHFMEWLDIFCEFALQQAKAGDRDKSYDTLQAAHFCNVFYHSAPSKKQIHATWLACALLLNDEQKVCDVARWFISEWSHSGAAYQLFAAVNRLFAGYSNWFNSGPTQKFILRQVKALDYALLDPESRALYAFTGQERSSYTQGGKRDANPHNLTELDPGVLALYGHIMAAAQSWTSALNYYFRVFTIEPENVTVNLCIATAYLQMAMKRQAENRHWQIYQGLAFLERYVEIRKATGKAVHKQESAYNVGRSWHLLGVLHLAVPAYEEALELTGKVREEAKGGGEVGGKESEGERQTEDAQTLEVQMRELDVDDEEDPEEFTQEAAFALASIYAMNENEAAARAVTEKWLVV